MNGLTLSVSQLNEYVRRSLAADPMLHGICLSGEISNLKRHVSGHWYFTMKDEDASISCAMFRQAATLVRFSPQNGQRVRLSGSVGLYAKTGSYQFYADAMEQDGLGELYLRFEALKARLAAEGLFDASLKKPLPLLPRGVGVITSKTGAVVHDIARIAWRRDPCMPLYLCPVKVQGEGAAEEIAQAIRLMDKLSAIDAIIVGRGGGSMEDLWAFNEEIVARAIFECGKPIISAVGHETDFTIADFAADMRAPTPSAAAELAVTRRDALRETVVDITARMARAFESVLSQKRLTLWAVHQRLEEQAPSQKSERLRAAMQKAMQRIEWQMAAQLSAKEHALGKAALRLRTSGPMETVKRGYAIVRKQGRPVKSAADIAIGDQLDIALACGGLQAAVTSVERGNGYGGKAKAGKEGTGL